MGQPSEDTSAGTLYPTRVTRPAPDRSAAHAPVGPGPPDAPSRATDRVQDVTDTGGSFDLELAAAQLRADSSDVGILVKVLVDQLSDALGSRLRSSGPEAASGSPTRSSRSPSPWRTTSSTPSSTGPCLRCTIGHSSGGIRIRSEKVDMDTWLNRLLTVLQAEADHSQAVRQALENIVIGGNA